MGADGAVLMGRPKKGIKTVPVRLSEDAIKWAKIASGYTGEAMVDYVSRIVIERGQQDADRLHEELKSGQPPTPAKSRRRAPSE